MRTALLFASAGFFAGVAVALMLAMETTPLVIPRREMLVLWPASIFGVDPSGWADGNFWDFLTFAFAFAGNGLIYAVFAGAFGALVEFARGT